MDVAISQRHKLGIVYEDWGANRVELRGAKKPVRGGLGWLGAERYLAVLLPTMTRIIPSTGMPTRAILTAAGA